MTKSFWKGVVLAICFSCTSLVFAAQELSRALTSTVSVTGQMTTNKFQQLMQQGFKSVIVNRPDQEQGNQVKVGQLRSIAEKSQVSVIYQPIMSGQISQANIEEFARSYNELPKPILMVCRSGTRSATLFNQAKSQGLIHE
ncbi:MULTISPECIES: beta-lactamase hydrolase domain-containing protein [unclassified Acinetobacter]|uniref:beta-lactamase hydrolase domain-containing protein n=1 Tax=unclassified Acinetobacter TaxID=196816 RepID=UPI0015D2E40C|nr:MULTISPECIES: sulfur transferase domain-containing protein [unclassified Acinetobacter]